MTLALAVAGCSDLGNPIRPQAMAVLSAASVDFGTVAVSGTATRNITVSNSGSAVLKGSATISCAGYQLVAGGGPFSIAPGESRAIEIRFAPGAAGSFSCTLDLGPGIPQVAVLGSGAEQVPGASCTIYPDHLNFGVVAVGQASAAVTFQVLSTGTAPLLVNVVSTNDDYRIVSGGGLVEIPAGKLITVFVEFRPQAGKKRPGAIAIGPGCPDVAVEGVGTTISFQNDLQPIFAARCDQSCHGHIFRDPTLAYRNLIDYGYVYPFDPVNSYLYYRITGADYGGGPAPMPPSGPLIPQEEQDKFLNWILEGAIDN